MRLECAGTRSKRRGDARDALGNARNGEVRTRNGRVLTSIESEQLTMDPYLRNVKGIAPVMDS